MFVIFLSLILHTATAVTSHKRSREAEDDPPKTDKKAKVKAGEVLGVQKNKPLKGIKEIKYTRILGVFGKSDKSFLSVYNDKHTLSSGKRIQVKCL